MGAIRSLTDEQIAEVMKVTGLSVKLLRDLREKSSDAEDTDASYIVDYRYSFNPYVAKHGAEDNTHLNNSVTMAGYVCITSLIEHIVRETANMFKGTKHEDDWVFYHDALTIMTAKDTVQWMREMDHYRRWILPGNALHKDNPALSRFVGRPVGDSPENMPWDCSLNNDVHLSVGRHVIFASWLENDDLKKFDMSTPVRGSHAYERILAICPSSKRVVQDIAKVFVSMECVRQANGKRVDGLGNRKGKRQGNAAKTELRGGYRPRKLGMFENKEIPIHPDAFQARQLKLEASQATGMSN